MFGPSVSPIYPVPIGAYGAAATPAAATAAGMAAFGAYTTPDQYAALGLFNDAAAGNSSAAAVANAAAAALRAAGASGSAAGYGAAGVGAGNPMANNPAVAAAALQRQGPCDQTFDPAVANKDITPSSPKQPEAKPSASLTDMARVGVP